MRPATLKDAARIAEIYNQGIADRVATFEIRERTEADILAWFGTRFPVIVVEREGKVIAFASTSTYRPRDCYAGIAEFSVYVAREARGLGAGRRAMEALIGAARQAGFWKLVSRVFPENLASLRLLKSVGFREVGVYERHGKLDGVWRDVVIVERLLDEEPVDTGMKAWQPDAATLDLWPRLTPGLEITVAKRAPDGQETAQYTAAVAQGTLPEPWIAVEAVWGHSRADISGLVFEPGDHLREVFSPRHSFNAFAVHTPDGTFKGWYANVTHPTLLERDPATGDLLMVWRDLYLDVVALPDGTVVLLDDDELDASILNTSDPALYARIRTARDELLRRCHANEPPFGIPLSSV